MRMILASILVLFAVHARAFTLTGDFKHGWRGPTLKFNFNLTNCPDDILEAFDDAVDAWNSVSTSFLKIKKGALDSTTTGSDLINGTAGDAPVVVCENNFGAVTGADENSVAGVGYSDDAGTGRLQYGGLILNTSGGNASIANKSRAKMAVVIAHEVGHVLGIGHSADQAALMYYSSTYKKELRLSQDDWDAMTYLYPRDELSGDALIGCGSVNSPLTPPWMWWLMLLPLLLLIKLYSSLPRKSQPALQYCWDGPARESGRPRG